MSVDREQERKRQAADNLFRNGREAVMEGDMQRGRELLLQAVEFDRGHSQAWLWLSATTDQPDEQRQYLEWAVAADPANVAARRGLGIVTGQINPDDLLPERETPPARQPAGPEQAQVEQTFRCPQCGGGLRYAAEQAILSCGHCGFTEAVVTASAVGSEQVLDFALPTVQGHRWAAVESRFTCRQCGGSTVLPPGQKTAACPYCGSEALIQSAEEAEMLPPQAILPMAHEDEAIYKFVLDWLGRGAFMPDNLVALAREHRLRPVYVPFWSFDASLTARWRAQAPETGGRGKRMVERTGERTLFFTNLLIPGTRGLPADILRQAEPFDLKGLVAFNPALLAGWPAGTYDVSLAQANAEARPIMLERAQRTLLTKGIAGQTLGDLTITSSDFTGEDYKLVLLPLWVGTYEYRRKTYRVLVNGQTGKVVGDKPIDWVLIVLIILAVFIAVIPLLTLLVITRFLGT